MEAYRDYDEFKSYINSKIKEAESEYRENYKSYILTEQDKRIKDFLDTLYCIKNVPDEDAVKILENSIIEIAFLSKKSAYMYIKIFNHKKLNPKLQKTTPLWYVLSKILEVSEKMSITVKDLSSSIVIQNGNSYIRVVFRIACLDSKKIEEYVSVVGD